MTFRLPLLGKILGWFFLNLLLLGLVAGAIFRSEFRLEALINGAGGERFQRVVDTLLGELRERPRDSWDATLQRFSTTYALQFLIVDDRGERLAGRPITLPDLVKVRLRPGRGPQRPDGRPSEGLRPPIPTRPNEFRGPGSENFRGRPPGGPPRLLIHTQNPSRYWIVFPTPQLEPGPRRLVAVADTLSAGGLLVDFRPWLWAGGAVLAISVLWWLPFVHRITRSLRQMTVATEQVADGRFDITVDTRRGDEIGRLGHAINTMAIRLERHLTGQKRFMGDVAHELCAPIARLQMALGILEQRADARQQPQLADLREELDQMSTLVNELLSFSKAGLKSRDLKLQRVPLVPLITRVLDREGVNPGEVEIRVDSRAAVLADPELLARALGNLIRNAVRYAGAAGPITLSTRHEGASLIISVADVGPGVAPEALARLGEPFYRPDAARTREQGGTGLGLAIVKTCVEACQGTLVLHNRQPQGFIAELQLADAGGSESDAPSVIRTPPMAGPPERS